MTYHSLTKARGRQSWYPKISHLAATFECQRMPRSIDNPVNQMAIHSLGVLSCLSPRKDSGGRAHARCGNCKTWRSRCSKHVDRVIRRFLFVNATDHTVFAHDVLARVPSTDPSSGSNRDHSARDGRKPQTQEAQPMYRLVRGQEAAKGRKWLWRSRASGDTISRGSNPQFGANGHWHGTFSSLPD